MTLPKRKPVRYPSAARRKQAFEQAVIPLRQDLLYKALGYLHNEQDAEDLVQETLLRAFNGWHTFMPGTNCRNWLLKILHNVFVSRYRRRRLEAAWLKETAGVLDALHSGARDRAHASPERQTAERTLRREVQVALSQMPAEYRQVLELRCMKGGSYRSIADTLSIPLGTVMSRLHRARRQLRSMVERRLTLFGRETEIRRKECPTQLVEACLMAA